MRNTGPAPVIPPETRIETWIVKGVDKVYHCGGEKLSHWYDDKGVQGE